MQLVSLLFIIVISISELYTVTGNCYQSVVYVSIYVLNGFAVSQYWFSTLIQDPVTKCAAYYRTYCLPSIFICFTVLLIENILGVIVLGPSWVQENVNASWDLLSTNQFDSGKERTTFHIFCLHTVVSVILQGFLVIPCLLLLMEWIEHNAFRVYLLATVIASGFIFGVHPLSNQLIHNYHFLAFGVLIYHFLHESVDTEILWSPLTGDDVPVCVREFPVHVVNSFLITVLPVEAMIRYRFGFNPYLSIATVIISVILSYLYTRFLHNFCQNISVQKLVINVFCVLLLNVFFITAIDRIDYRNSVLTVPIKKNHGFLFPEIFLDGCQLDVDRYCTPPWGLCNFPKGYGKLKVIIVGDELARNEAKMIKELLNDNYSTISVFATPKNPAMFNSDPDVMRDNLQVVCELNADIVIIIHRYSREELGPLFPLVDTVLNDYTYFLPMYRQCSKRVIIQGPLPRIPAHHLTQFIRDLELGNELEERNLENGRVEFSLRFSRLRLPNSCSDCEFIEPTVPFRFGNSFRLFDPVLLHSYFDNNGFLTPSGLKMLRSEYKKVLGV